MYLKILQPAINQIDFLREDCFLPYRCMAVQSSFTAEEEQNNCRLWKMERRLPLAHPRYLGDAQSREIRCSPLTFPEK